MSEDIADAQEVEDLRHQLPRLHSADVTHHLRAGPGLLTGGDGAPERLEPVSGDHVLRHPHLDPEHHVGVLGDRLGGVVDPREIDVVELRHGKAGEPHVGDVHEREQARARLRADVAAEGGDVVGAGIARRHAGRGALAGDQLVGRDADRRAIGIHVGMKIDQSWRHQLPAGVEHAQRARRRNVRLDRFDKAVADADVASASQRLARIQHVAPLDHEIKFVVRAHGRKRLAAHAGRERQRAGRREQTSTRYNRH